jgi:hypothetical protein
MSSRWPRPPPTGSRPPRPRRENTGKPPEPRVTGSRPAWAPAVEQVNGIQPVRPGPERTVGIRPAGSTQSRRCPSITRTVPQLPPSRGTCVGWSGGGPAAGGQGRAGDPRSRTTGHPGRGPVVVGHTRPRPVPSFLVWSTGDLTQRHLRCRLVTSRPPAARVLSISRRVWASGAVGRGAVECRGGAALGGAGFSGRVWRGS